MGLTSSHTHGPSPRIARASLHDVETILPLFSAYRSFYNCPDAPGACRDFLRDRLMNGESVIFLAQNTTPPQNALGFVQLYPVFSSLHLQPDWILNDLYVVPEARQQGVAIALIEAAQAWVMEREDRGLVLETAPDNMAAKALYARCGFIQQNRFECWTWRAHTRSAPCPPDPDQPLAQVVQA